jgi:hypothetical protein
MKLILLLLLNLMLFVLNGQEFKHHLLVFKGGVGTIVTKDLGISALRYHGSGFNGEVAYKREGEKKQLAFMLQYQRGINLENTAGVGSMNTNQYGFLNNVFYQTKWHNDFFLGWTSNNVLHVSDASVSINFNGRMHYSTNFGMAAKWLYRPKKFAHKLTLEFPVFYQILGFKVNSGLVSNVPNGFLETNSTTLNGFFNSVSFYNPLLNTEFGFVPSVTYKLKNGNQCGIHYNFHFFKLSDSFIHRRLASNWSLFFNALL